MNGSEMPELWSKLLFTYGPFALLVFLVFIIEAKARHQRHESGGAWIYGVTWAAIFVMCGVITIAWWNLNFIDHEVAIHGRLTGWQGDWDLRSTSSQMYVRKVYDKANYDIEFRIYETFHASRNELVDFIVDRSSSDQHEDLARYQLDFSSGAKAPEREVVLHFNPTNREITVRNMADVQVLKPLDLNSLAWPLPKMGFVTPFISIVHAQSSSSLDKISMRLESNDAIIRLKARSELAQAGVQAIPFINEALGDSETSYRVRLGVVSALNKMQNGAENSLSRVAACKIVAASEQDDAALKAEAEAFLASHAHLVTNCPRSSRPAPRVSQDVRPVEATTNVAPPNTPPSILFETWSTLESSRDISGAPRFDDIYKEVTLSVFDHGIQESSGRFGPDRQIKHHFRIECDNISRVIFSVKKKGADGEPYVEIYVGSSRRGTYRVNSKDQFQLATAFRESCPSVLTLSR
jgi:hypothetical protein